MNITRLITKKLTLFYFTNKIFVYACVYVVLVCVFECVCMCVRERETKRDREKEKERERERSFVLTLKSHCSRQVFYLMCLHHDTERYQLITCILHFSKEIWLKCLK